MNKILSLIGFVALLTVSTAVLSDGRPTGIRITRLVSGGGTNVELDVSVTGTDAYYGGSSYSVWIGNTIENTFYGGSAWQYLDDDYSEHLPWAVDWGDGSQFGAALLLGGGPWTGTFAHTYTVPGTYTVTVGDALCCRFYPEAPNPTVLTGNAITGQTRYIWGGYPSDYYQTFYYSTGTILAVTANATVSTGTGIPALNLYGLLAMAFVLVGAGLSLFRRRQDLAT